VNIKILRRKGRKKASKDFAEGRDSSRRSTNCVAGESGNALRGKEKENKRKGDGDQQKKRVMRKPKAQKAR